MKRLVLGLVASAMAAVFAVSSTPACSTSPGCSELKCSADPLLSSSTIQACEDAKAGACSSQYEAARACANGKLTCGSDNRTDPVSAIKARSECSAEDKAFAECTKAKSPAATCARPKCTAEPPESEDYRLRCEARLAGPCGASYTALRDCQSAATKCTAENKTDPLNPAIFTACTAQEEADYQCELKARADAGSDARSDVGADAAK